MSVSEPNEPPADEVADALKAKPRICPTDPTIIEYERQGKVVAWHRVTRAVLRLPEP